MDTSPDVDETTVVACSLGHADAERQLADWAALRAACVRAEASDGSAHLWFEPAAEEPLRDVVSREVDCCPFLTLTVDRDGPFIRLSISSPSPTAQPVIDALVAHASRGAGSA
jgi:hypothetical protein